MTPDHSGDTKRGTDSPFKDRGLCSSRLQGNLLLGTNGTLKHTRFAETVYKIFSRIKQIYLEISDLEGEGICHTHTDGS